MKVIKFIGIVLLVVLLGLFVNILHDFTIGGALFVTSWGVLHDSAVVGVCSAWFLVLLYVMFDSLRQNVLEK